VHGKEAGWGPVGYHRRNYRIVLSAVAQLLGRICTYVLPGRTGDEYTCHDVLFQRIEMRSDAFISGGE
jgi:hypothetical protein